MSDLHTKHTELAWAAGFFDGEGHTRNVRGAVMIQIGQVTREELDRFQRAVGVGRVLGPYQRSRFGVPSQPLHFYYATSYAEVQHVIAQMWSWLSSAKREQARAALVRSRTYKKKWKVCEDNGHRIRNYGGRPQCLDCTVERQRSRRSAAA